MSQSPTPWRLDADGDIIAANQVLVAFVPCKDDRVILAAAPDLLQFAKQVSAYAADAECFYLMSLAENIINKAEGKS